ncbi:MAG: hypothetical protein WD768_00245 [Phycisphaeraceae bacterium]
MIKSLSVALCGFITLSAATFAAAATEVKVTDVHLCCKACVNGVNKATADVKGATVEADQKTKTVTIKAETDEAAAAAVKALADAGFHGTVSDAKLAMKYDDKLPEGKVKRLALNVGHNCCGACTTAIKKAVEKVAGVKAVAAKAKDVNIVIEGEFDAKAVVTALREAGFGAKTE